MKVIITGSEGFVGHALSLALQKCGLEVIGIDRNGVFIAGS
ncbi:MAG: NAD-dependent epimerase/dehydratase family protein [Muribaculaceae bacterium]|nr:NAD-dependent epimerase/dehydratase family protein [Muribaculaceae bacterium]